MSLAKANVFLLALAVLLAIPTAMQLRGETDVFKDVSRVPLLFDGFTSDNVGYVTLGQPKKEQPPPDPQNPDQKRPVEYDQLVLQKTDKGFQTAMAGDRGGVPINKDRVESDVFAHLRAIRADRETMVQPNATPAQLEQFGLDDAHAFVIKVTDANSKNIVAQLMVGKDAGGGQAGADQVRGVYVRKSDSNDVILYELDRAWRRDVQETLWIDRTLVRVQPDKVRRLTIRNTATAGTTFTFEREVNKAFWNAVEPPADVGAVRQTEVESLVAKLANVVVQEYRVPMKAAGNLQQLGLLPPQIEISFTTREGDQQREIRLNVGNRVDDKNEYYLTSSESQFLMTWPAGLVTQFELDVKKQMFDPKGPSEPPTIPPPPEKDDKK